MKAILYAYITHRHLVTVTKSIGDKYQRIQPFFLVSVTNIIWKSIPTALVMTTKYIC